MQYVHVKNLEKYHPGYRDGRAILWMKLYFKCMNGDAEFEMLHEIDQIRYFKLAMLELQNCKPVPWDGKYLIKKNFNSKDRPLSKTLEALRPFVIVTEVPDEINVTEIVKARNGMLQDVTPEFEAAWQEYPQKGRIGKKLAWKRWQESVKTPQDAQDCMKAIASYKDSQQVKKGYIKNAPTFFNEWQDWAKIDVTKDEDGIPWRTELSTKR